MGRTIIFDADDTLWENQALYNKVLDQFCSWCGVTLEGVTKEKARETVTKWNIWVAQEKGLGQRTSFPMALVRAYDELLREEELGDPMVDEIDYLLELGNSAYTDQMKLYDGVIDTLSNLSALGWNIVILTIGDKVIQSSKILNSGAYKFIDRWHIVDKKNVETYEEMKQKYGDSIIMVGNSVKSDVNPAVEAGIPVIYIPHNTWAYEQEELVDSHLVHRVQSIKEVVNVVRQLTTPAIKFVSPPEPKQVRWA